MNNEGCVYFNLVLVGALGEHVAVSLSRAPQDSGEQVLVFGDRGSCRLLGRKVGRLSQVADRQIDVPSLLCTRAFQMSAIVSAATLHYSRRTFKDRRVSTQFRSS